MNIVKFHHSIYWLKDTNFDFCKINKVCIYINKENLKTIHKL